MIKVEFTNLGRESRSFTAIVKSEKDFYWTVRKSGYIRAKEFFFEHGKIRTAFWGRTVGEYRILDWGA